MKFIIWQLTIGWRWYWKRVWFNLKKIFHYFSFQVLLKSLLAPWKRLTAQDEVIGFDIGKFFENLTFDLISRIIGMIVRLILIVSCLLISAIYLGLSILFFVVWLVVPFMGWGYYERDQRRSLKVLKDLENEIRTNPIKSGEIIFESEMGKFIRNRLERNIDGLLMSTKVKIEDLADFDGSSFEKIIVWYLSKNKHIFGDLQKLEMSETDLILAAKWWDRRQINWKLDEEDRWSLGRPGIGSDLVFGYTPNLNKYSENLSLKQNFASHLIGREDEVKKMGKVIDSGKNILLVGNPGVGKKTVVYAFADMAITGKLGNKLTYKKTVLFNYQAAMSVSNDKDYKKKILTGLLKEAEAAGNIILVIKDIFKIIDAEVEGNDYMDVISSVLEKRKLNMIAMCGQIEYERFLATDQRFLKYFEVIEITQPSEEEAMMILLQAIDRIETNSKKKFSVQAVRQILEGSDRYITDIPFPEKVLELMDRVAVSETKKTNWITKEDVNKVLSEMTGISVNRLTENEKIKLGNLEKIIKGELIGQEMAVNLIAKSLRSRVAAVKNEDKPIGSFLFLGPTGVGKTQTAKVLADVYYGSRAEILRFDMAEYTGYEGLEKLVGSINGNHAGLMTSQIRNKPASLLLLDEIEKAPSEIYNLFLTMLDEGYINDASGNKVICRHLFVIATSNAGAEFIRECVKKGISGEELQNKVIEYVQKEKIFSPEFLNRFDGVVVFEPLKKETLIEIAKLMLDDFKENLLQKNITVSFDEKVIEKIAEDGYNIEFGARPMRRIVELVLGDLIGKAIIENKIMPGDNIKITVDADKNEYIWTKI